jgi:hypothetical protein
VLLVDLVDLELLSSTREREFQEIVEFGDEILFLRRKRRGSKQGHLHRAGGSGAVSGADRTGAQFAARMGAATRSPCHLASAAVD